MDDSILQGLQNRLYEKRKSAAYEVEKLTRECLNNNDTTRIRQIINILCQDFIYGPSRVANSMFGGLIGLAAVVIAIGQDVAEYLEDIVPPVLSCFSDQEYRVRYYACESMYNIAKVAKGEILLYFNEIFDALSKLSSDTEPSVKNGAELLDRLIKDIVSEKTTSYTSVLHSCSPVNSSKALNIDSSALLIVEESKKSIAFSLEKFIPMLSERIYVINPFTRMFLVSWITVLDSVPDLELITYLPKFLDGLIKFLSDSHQDVRNVTDRVLMDFLSEIKRISNIKKGLVLKKVKSGSSFQSLINGDDTQNDLMFVEDGKWIPGQDVFIHYSKIIEILLPHISSSEESIQLMALRWIAEFFNICPVDLLKFIPRLISLVLPALSLGGESSRQAALEINQNLCNLVSEALESDKITMKLAQFHSSKPSSSEADLSFYKAMKDDQKNDVFSSFRDILDYSSTVNALTLQFLDEHEQTRVAALNWLIMLHNLAPQKVLTLDDGTFPCLLKILSDPSDEVIIKDLQLLAQISSANKDDYFDAFMVNLLSLFSTDRRLLETRGSLIVRQLCIYLKSERIYCTLAENLEKDEDLEFASIMVQNLNNNLMTSPELSDFRKRLKNLEFKDGQSLFVSLYRCWCHNAVATFSLCLLAQAYEQAANLLQIFAELEMTVSMLVQIDTLVQLLESPVFTYLRLQLLEPDKYPYLYKCLYGLLMLLPQSSAFSTLKNRLNSVSSIGLFQFFSKQNNPEKHKLKNKADEMRWPELLEKFRSVQNKHEKARQQNKILISKTSGSFLKMAPISYLS
ncbi:hypothetical protein T552_01137 [Pneumocystis carinii B80]|uniref:Vacuolar protein 14 C-terminal Fig4-binding domain-containing protein n=1 Tax=Pneumocystis carinii (strain B80) TaxID=1408658 RepID=A0A0W4ZLD7_PNEC8|nr:hypothetical protein T552_01137 [Pneumocystis carinii B80]KTW29180.1 hypothetical protein T552_01137 [Pneumocystis carinii B80]